MKIAQFYDVVVKKSYTEILYENIGIESLGAFLPVITSATNDEEKITYTVIPKLDEGVLESENEEDDT